MRYIMFILAIAFSNAAFSQSHVHGGMPGAGRDGSSSSYAERRENTAIEERPATFLGEVHGVDRESGKVTLKHGSLPILDIPSGTMVYPVKDVSMLSRLNLGDQVRFTAVLQGRQLLITRIVPLLNTSD